MQESLADPAADLAASAPCHSQESDAGLLSQSMQSYQEPENFIDLNLLQKTRPWLMPHQTGDREKGAVQMLSSSTCTHVNPATRDTKMATLLRAAYVLSYSCAGRAMAKLIGSKRSPTGAFANFDLPIAPHRKGDGWKSGATLQKSC